MLPMIKTPIPSRTSDQLSIFNPLVKGLRWVIAKSEMKNDISNIMPKMRPAVHGTVVSSRFPKHFTTQAYIPVKSISKRIKFMRTLEFLHTMENTIDIMPAASRAKSRPAQTAVRVRDDMESKVANDRVLKVGLHWLLRT